jgi:hypothetical protein
METGLLHLHNILRWVILILLLVSIVKSYSAWKSKKVFTAGDKKLWLFTMVAAHITLLIGLYQVTMGRFGMFVAKLPEGTSLMKDKFFRFYWVEHPTAMLLATILITVGRGMSKKLVADEVKFRKAFWLFFIALILILAGIPWPFREIIGRPLIPGM